MKIKAAKMFWLCKVWHKEFKGYQEELRREGVGENWTKAEKVKKLTLIANFDVVDPLLVESMLLLYLERCILVHSLAIYQWKY